MKDFLSVDPRAFDPISAMNDKIDEMTSDKKRGIRSPKLMRADPMYPITNTTLSMKLRPILGHYRRLTRR